MMIKITDSNIKKIRQFKQMLTSSYYADGNEVTSVYNEVFGTALRPTNCGSCIRQRMTQLVSAMEAVEQRMNAMATEAKEERKKSPNGKKAKGKGSDGGQGASQENG